MDFICFHVEARTRPAETRETLSVWSLAVRCGRGLGTMNRHVLCIIIAYLKSWPSFPAHKSWMSRAVRQETREPQLPAKPAQQDVQVELLYSAGGGQLSAPHPAQRSQPRPSLGIGGRRGMPRCPSSRKRPGLTAGRHSRPFTCTHKYSRIHLSPHLT